MKNETPEEVDIKPRFLKKAPKTFMKLDRAGETADVPD
jgi:hypothetical protein